MRKTSIKRKKDPDKPQEEQETKRKYAPGKALKPARLPKPHPKQINHPAAPQTSRTAEAKSKAKPRTKTKTTDKAPKTQDKKTQGKTKTRTRKQERNIRERQGQERERHRGENTRENR